jgi:glycosyltransferase 2 family protein
MRPWPPRRQVRCNRLVRLRGRRWWSFLPALIVTGGALYLALRGVELDAVGHSLASSNYLMLVPAVVAMAIAVVLRIVRWQLLFPEPTRPPFRPAAETLLLANFFNNILPARAGEAVRIIALHARSGTSRAETFATIVVERAFDVLALLLLLFVTLPWLPAISWLRAAALLAAGASLAVAVVVVALARYGPRPVLFLLRPLAWLPYLSKEGVEGGALGVVRGLAALRQARLGLSAFILGVISWLVLAVSCWFIAVGFVSDLSLLAGVLVAVAIGLALILPSGPAALGVFEAAVIAALAAYDVPQSTALSAALVIHAAHVFPYFVAGAFVLLAWRRRPADLPPA